MSGHLQRLAARAMGRTRPLRTLSPSPLLEAEAMPAVVDAPMPRVMGEVPPDAHGDPRREFVTVPVAPDIPAPVEHARAAEPLEAAGNAGPEVPPPLVPTGRVTAGLTEMERGNEATPSRVLQRPLLPSIPRETVAIESVSPQATALGISAQPGHTSSFSPPAEPPRLMPVSAPSVVQAPLPVSLRGPSGIPESLRVGGAVEETTEVHVNIGRIEVTAVQEAPAQKPAPRRRQQPMSLDEYLSRRQGGRP